MRNLNSGKILQRSLDSFHMDDKTTQQSMTPKEVASLLNRCEVTLLNWRKRKLGPPFYRMVGRIVYFRHEVEEWRKSSRWG